MPLTPEQRAREKIDGQLEACGWVVQDFKSMNIHAGRGVAVREYPLKWKEGETAGFKPLRSPTAAAMTRG